MDTKKILIVEDHPLIIEGYQNVLQKMDNCYVAICKDSDKAKELLKSTKFHLVLLDINLADKDSLSNDLGFYLGTWIRCNINPIKIVIITSHEEKCLIFDLTKKISPDGFLLKSECSSTKLRDCITEVFKGNIYFDLRVKSAINDINKSTVLLDNINRQILHLLDQGVLTKNMPDYLPLSLSAIDKRKVILRDLFGLQKATDEEILRAARISGLI